MPSNTFAYLSRAWLSTYASLSCFPTANWAPVTPWTLFPSQDPSRLMLPLTPFCPTNPILTDSWPPGYLAHPASPLSFVCQFPVAPCSLCTAQLPSTCIQLSLAMVSSVQSYFWFNLDSYNQPTSQHPTTWLIIIKGGTGVYHKLVLWKSGTNNFNSYTILPTWENKDKKLYISVQVLWLLSQYSDKSIQENTNGVMLEDD